LHVLRSFKQRINKDVLPILE